MRLLHYTAAPFQFDPTRTYDSDRSGFLKPGGLWVSVEGEDDWPSWCKDNEFAGDGLAHCTEIILKSDANIPHLRAAQDVLAFQWCFQLPYSLGTHDIDWPRVNRMYHGVIIAPYVHSLRLDSLWYYGWDCASGVIWNLDAIERTVPLLTSQPA